MRNKNTTRNVLGFLGLICMVGACIMRRDTVMLQGATPATGKPRPPISLEYSINKSTEPGTVVTVHVSGKPLLDVSSFKIAVRLPAGVDLVGGNPVAESHALASGQSLSTSFTIRAGQRGMYYLALDGRYVSGGQTASDTISIPFQVGEPEALQKPGLIKDSGGEKIIEMQVE